MRVLLKSSYFNKKKKFVVIFAFDKIIKQPVIATYIITQSNIGSFLESP